MSRWPLRKAYFWQEAPLLRPLLLLAAGIVCYDRAWIAAQHFTAMLLLLTGSGLALTAAAVFRRRTGWLNGVFGMAIVLFFILLGWCAYAATDVRNRHGWYGRNTDTAGLSLVRVAEEPQPRAVTTKLVAEVLGRQNISGATPASGQALLYLYRAPGADSISLGDTLLIPARWQAIRNSGNPFEFDNAAFQHRKGVCFQQFLSPDEVVMFGKGRAEQAGWMQRTHSWCSRQLKAYIRDSAALGLMQAMLLGDEQGFDPELRQAYSQTGVIHIVSISGSHVAVLFLVVSGLLFWIRGRRGQVIKSIAGVLLVWMYVVIAGAPPPALRSAIMFSFFALSIISNREGTPLSTLTGAAFILLLGNPAWLFSVGFQLSFGAVLSILIFYKPVYEAWRLPQRTWLSQKIWQGIAVSCAAELLTAPLVIYYFHNFPLLFFAGNLLAALLAGFCALVGGMAVIAFCWIPLLARMLGWVVTLLVTLFNNSIRLLQRWNFTALQVLQISAAETILLYVIIATLGAWRLRQSRTGLLIALPAACVLFGLLSADKYQALRQHRLVVYNNGRLPLAEQITGDRFQPLTGNGSNNYNVKAAHIGWHAWRQSADNDSLRYFSAGGKTVLLLTDTTVQSFTNPLPADVLVIARSLRLLRIGEVLRAFTPKEVVLAARPSAYHLQRWTDSCAAHHIALHIVSRDGAYVAE